MKKKFGLPKTSRISKKKDILNLKKSNQVMYFQYYKLIYKKNNIEESRILISISKKFGCAVLRNRYKRIIKEYFRLNRIDFKTNLDLFFIMIKKPSSDLENKNELKRIFECLKELKL